MSANEPTSTTGYFNDDDDANRRRPPNPDDARPPAAPAPDEEPLDDEGPDVLTALRAAAYAEWQAGRGHWLPVVEAIDRGDTLLGRTR